MIMDVEKSYGPYSESRQVKQFTSCLYDKIFRCLHAVSSLTGYANTKNMGRRHTHLNLINVYTNDCD